MPAGFIPIEYLNTPRVNKPVEEMYADMDTYTNEFFEGETEFYHTIDFFVPLPPLQYEGKVLKGIFFSQGMDLLHKLYPELPQLFFSAAYSMRAGYPFAKSPDAYLTCYSNPHREQWFRKANPHRANKILIPLQDADYTNEYVDAPRPVESRDIDVLCVARLDVMKNIWMLAAGLKVYRQKYPEHRIRMTLIAGKNFDLNLNGLDDDEIAEYRKIEEVLIHPAEYIDFIPWVDGSEIAKYYSRAKLCILGSLGGEGKNRTLNEAMSCNTPVAAFADLNWYSRGPSPLFPSGAGLCIPHFNPESVADTIRTILMNHGDFKPRKRYLETNGRKKFLNTCVDSFPYYEKELPGYTRGRHHENLWLDLAIQDNYQISLNDFLYDRNTAISHGHGLEGIAEMLNFYFARFGIERAPIVDEDAKAA